jgi:hypothetical protein
MVVSSAIGTIQIFGKAAREIPPGLPFPDENIFSWRFIRYAPWAMLYALFCHGMGKYIRKFFLPNGKTEAQPWFYMR